MPTRNDRESHSLSTSNRNRPTTEIPEAVGALGGLIVSVLATASGVLAAHSAISRFFIAWSLVLAVGSILIVTIVLSTILMLRKLGRTRRLTEEVTGAYQKTLRTSFLNPRVEAKTGA
jgi:uncharacterized membrane protein (DUF485 family)